MYQHINQGIFIYRGLDRLFHKRLKGYQGYVNDHHIIPQSLKQHKLIREVDFDIHSNDNIFIMPKKIAFDKFNMHPSTMIHESNHLKYNTYVKSHLNIINTYHTSDERCYYLWLFVSYLKKNLKFNNDNIPWD